MSRINSQLWKYRFNKDQCGFKFFNIFIKLKAEIDHTNVRANNPVEIDQP